MSINYISLGRALACMRSSYTGVDNNVLLAMIQASSCWLDNYCNRASGGFISQSYDELYNGTGERILFLNNIPIQSIQRIGTIEQPALEVHNTDSDNGCRALVSISGTAANPINLNSQQQSTGMTFTLIKNAVTTNNTLLWSDYPTVNSLVSAINALGHGWTANTMGGLGTSSTTDLRATQGSFGCRIVSAYFWVHWLDMPWYRINENTGEIYSEMGWARGVFRYRIQYTAGYTVFPDDLAQALGEIVANTYYAQEINSNLASERLGPVDYRQFDIKGFEGLSIVSRNTINRYKIRCVRHFSDW